MLRHFSNGLPYDSDIMENLDRTMTELVADESLPFGFIQRMVDFRDFLPSASTLVSYIQGEGREHFSPDQIQRFYATPLFADSRKAQSDYENICHNAEISYHAPRDVIRYALMNSFCKNGAVASNSMHNCPAIHPSRGKLKNTANYTLLRARTAWQSSSQMNSSVTHLTYFDVCVLGYRRHTLIPEMSMGFTLRELINALVMSNEDASRRNNNYQAKNFSLTYYTENDKILRRINHKMLMDVVPEGTALEWHYIAGWGGRGANIDSRIKSIAELSKRYTADEILVFLRNDSFSNVNEIWRYVRAGITLEDAAHIGGRVTPTAFKKMSAAGLDIDLILSAVVK